MKTKLLISVLLFFGFLTTVFSQNEVNTSPALERVFRSIREVEYSYNSEMQAYIVNYTKLSSTASIIVKFSEENHQPLLIFLTCFGKLKTEDLESYQAIREINNKYLLGSLILTGEENGVWWCNVMMGIDRAPVEYYFDYFLNNQYTIYNELQEYLVQE